MHSIKVETKQYVCFDSKTGEIFSIGPSQEPEYEYIEVTEDEIEPIQTYKEKMEDYKVIFSSASIKFELRKLENIDIESNFTLNPVQEKITDPYYDVVFTVDKRNNLCYISTIESLSNVKFDTNIMFSITKKDDPHFLIKSVDYKVGEETEFSMKADSSYSIYTNSNSLRCVYEEIQ